jgi:hypothetical protein
MYDSERRKWRIIYASLFIVVLCFLALTAFLFQLSRHGSFGPRERCVFQLRNIDGAKRQWEIENDKSAGDVPSWENLKPYLGNREVPQCPKGGSYSLGGAVSNPPTCSIRGHHL